MEKLKEKKNLNEDWDLLTSRLNDKDLVEKLKVKNFKTWINIRVNSFLKTWLSIVRRETSYKNRTSSYS